MLAMAWAAHALALPAHAQGLAEALELAWARHPQASAAPASADEARARIAAADELLPGAPTVAIAQKSDRLDSRHGKQEWELEVSAPVWLPRQRAARQAEGEALAAAVTGRNAALRLALAGELRETWWAVAASRLAVEVSERRVATAQALLDDVMRRHRAGDLARIDANLARTELLAAQVERTEAQLAEVASGQAWTRLTGRSAPPHIEAERAAGPPPHAAEPLDAHPRLVEGLAAVRLARARLALAEQFSRDQPEFALRAWRERSEASEPYANQFGFRVSIPLSFGPRVRQESLAAQAELIRAETEFERLRDQLRIDLARATVELDAAGRQLEAARQRRALAADNVLLAQKSFALGESDLVALLRVRAADFEAEAFHHRQLAHRGLAESRLRQARGEMP
jgi:outer membrane protein TolC